jgi:hypothetical protein
MWFAYIRCSATDVFCMGPPQDYISGTELNQIRERAPHLEAGSNISTVTLRVVGGDEKGSLKSQTVKYGREYQGTWTRERLRCKGQQHIQKADPSSRQRGRPTQTRP